MRYFPPSMDERIEITAEAQLWDWLAAHHGRAAGVWLVTHKKAAGATYVGNEAVLDALIAYGWTDGRKMKVDDRRTAQWIAPRRQQIWAETYRRRAARLEAEGRMQPPGRAAVAAAKAAGLWEAWDDVDALEVPEDLAAALREARGADWFDAAAPSYRRNVLRWLRGAKTAPTRQKRIAEIARRAGAGQKVPQF